MKLSLLLALPLVCAAPLFVARTPVPQDDEAMAGMMAKAAKYTQPGEHHLILEKLVGEWEVVARMTIGGSAGPESKGLTTTRWKIEGRWLESEWNGTIMGMQGRDIQWLGYDNLKQSYVMTRINGFDTAMNRAEGDMTPGGDALIMYGTLDEYLTGEHDKMVKYVHRFSGERAEGGGWKSIDRIVLEVHDLAIGEANTKVLEFTYTRQSTSTRQG